MSNSEQGINVLSLFDGMSVGRIALQEAGIKINRYFASEIDKYANAQTKLNFPDTVQLGDVTKVRAKDLPKIDLLIGGSPCQGFSFAGKQLNFSDPRSALFFEYVRILREVQEINPNAKFLLENVRMRKEYEAIISQQLGLYAVVINSALVSAQHRIRLYWTNIRTRTEGLFNEVYTDIPQPADKGLFLKDILEDSVDEKYYIREEKYKHKRVQKNTKSHESKAFTLLATMYKGAESNGMTVVAEPMIIQRAHGANNGGQFYDKTPTLTASAWQHNNLLSEPQKEPQTVISGTFRTYKDDFGFREIKSGKAGTIPARARQDGRGQNCAMVGGRLRRLTPTECARLQTIPTWYKWACSETQQYKMLGNGWTVDVIKHIFSFLKT